VEVAAAWGARGAEVAGGRQRRREVVGGDRATVVSPRARGRALAETRSLGPLASGPCHFSDFFKILKHPHFDIRIGDLPDV
jgi:hypothetical protein